MADTTTVDLGVTTDPGITTTFDPAAITFDPALTTATPINEAIPSTELAPTFDTATIISTNSFAQATFASNTIFTSNPTVNSSTLLTSIRPTQTSTDGPPFSGPPPFLTAGGRPPFASGSGPPFFDDDEPQSLSAGAKAGIGVGVVALVFSIAAVVLLIWRMKKKERGNGLPQDEPLPSYAESNPPTGGPVGGAAAPAMSMVPKSAMKKVAPGPLMLDLHNSGSSTPVYAGASTERRRSYAMEGTDKPLVLSIWEPANKSASSSANNSPVLGPAPPPKVHRKSNPGSRPRRKSNLAPVSEETPESSDSRLALVKDDDGSSSSAPPTPRTPRSAAFRALTGGGADSGPNSPMNSSFTLEPVPPLPESVSPKRAQFRGKS